MHFEKRYYRVALLLFLVLTGFTALSQVNYRYFLRSANDDIAEKRFVDAVTKLNTALKYKPDGFEAYFLRGVAKYNLGDYAGAVSDFTNTVNIHSLYIRAYFYRGICYESLKEYYKALADFDKAISLDPYTAAFYMGRGDTKLDVRDYKGAVKDYNKAIELNDKNANVYLNRGIAYHFMGNDSAAIADINTAIKMEPFNMEGWLKRGLVYYEMDSADKALPDFNKAISIDSSYLLSYFQRGLVYLKKGDTLAALSDYGKVLKLDSTNSLTYYNRGLLYSMTGKYNKAIEDFSKVIALNPFNVYGYFNRGVTYAQMEDFKNAEHDFSSAIKIFPDFVAAYINRSSVRMRMGDQKGAYRDQLAAKDIIAKVEGSDKDIATLYKKYSDSVYFNKIIEFEADFVSGNMKRGRVQFNRVKIEPKPDIFIVNAFSVSDDLEEKFKRFEYTDTHFAEFNSANTLGLRLLFTTLQWPVNEKEAERLAEVYKNKMLATGDSAGAAFITGVIKSMLHEYMEAVNEYDKTVSYNHSFVYAYFNRAASRVAMDEFIYSEKLYKSSIGISLGSVKSQKEEIKPPDHKKSMEDYNKVIEIYPGLPYTYYNRANLKTILKKYQRAIDDYSKAIHLKPDFAEAYFNRALTLLYLKENKLACKDLSKAGELGINESYNIIKRYCGK